MKMKLLHWCLLVFLCGLIITFVAFADQHAVNLSGRWVGTWAGFGASSESAELRLQQTGSSVIGTIELLEALPFGTGPIALSGVVQGMRLYLRVSGGCPLNAQLEYSANKLEGYFSCGVYTGNSLTIYRQD